MSESPRSLHALLAAWHDIIGPATPRPPAYDGPDVSLTLLTEKTGEVIPGACFIARVRETSDGHPYISRALELGARMILAQRPAEEVGVVVPPGVAYVVVPDTAEATAWLAAAWEGFPSHDLVMVGVTGTDGKTSTSNLLFGILRAAGLRAGLLSTIKAVVGDDEEPLELHVTTPEAPVVQRYLRRMVDAGMTHCVLECTSHGLAQHRVSAIDFDISVVTNITHEHLDYHGSYEAYFEAKSRLFARLLDKPWLTWTRNPAKLGFPRAAVLNADDGSYAGLNELLRGRGVRVLTYGLGMTGVAGTPDVMADTISYGPDETRLLLRGMGSRPLAVASALVGPFNVYNMLAAAAAARVLGADPEAVRDGLESVRSLSGRMQRIDRGQPFLVVVDFAHTPNALEKAIGAARPMASASGRVIAVFGSAGKRDREKRRLMAEIAARDADLSVLTAEDPRTESLDAILETMAAAAASRGGIEGQTFWRVPDRGRAIHFALTLASSGDVVLICGKGHEQSMCFGVTEYPWDDREATRAALDAWLADEPMPDLGLPTY